MAEHRGFNLENLNLNKARVNGYKIIEKILNTSCPTGHGLYDSILSPVEVGNRYQTPSKPNCPPSIVTMETSRQDNEC